MSSPNNDLNLLDKNFKKKVDAFMADPRTIKLGVRITEGRRTLQRQRELYAQGRTKPGKIVTGTMQSMHLIGKAIDTCKIGSTPYPADQNWWDQMFAIAKEYGMNNLWQNGLKFEKAHLEDNLLPLRTADEKQKIQLIISGNSALWGITLDQQLKKKLEEFNNYLRSI